MTEFRVLVLRHILAFEQFDMLVLNFIENFTKNEIRIDADKTHLNFWSTSQ